MSTVANFQIDYHQCLDANGELIGELPSFANDPEHLLKLYKFMVLTRVFDTKSISLQRTGKMGTYASTLGQEAISVALGDAMQKDDVLVPAYREYGAQLQRGTKMEEILSYWGGDERGNCYTDSDDMSISVPIASQCLHAAGIAKAFQLRRQKRCAVSVCGDGATSQGDFYEAMNVAGAWKLPVIFLVNNNQWAISVSREIQTGAETLAQKAIAAGIASEQVDGNDIFAIRDSLGKAINAARESGTPFMIEAITYRLSDHTTADDATRYRSDEELKTAWDNEPIIRFKKYLMNTNLWTEEQEEQLQTESKAKVDEAVQRYFNRTPQAPESILNFIFETLPAPMQDQYDELIENTRKS